MMGKQLSNDEAWTIWRKGWDSAVSVAEAAIQELMSQFKEDIQTLSVRIPRENFDLMKLKVERGLWKNMRLAERGGLDYYFAATNPASLKENNSSQPTPQGDK